MKIIGKGNDGFIIEVSRTEMAHLIGYYYENNEYPPLDVGTDFPVSKMFMQLYELCNQRERLEQAIATLRGTATLLEPICPIINSITKGEDGHD